VPPIGVSKITPLIINELGQAVPLNQTIFTATNPDGGYDSTLGPGCSGWTVTTGGVTQGRVDSVNDAWTYSGGIDATCSTLKRLYCFQTGTDGDPLPNKTEWGKRGAFVSTGAASGIAAADNACKREAQNAGFYQPNSYKAYLSGLNAQNQPINAKDRFIYDGPWIRADGLRLADGKNHLATGNLRRPLNVRTDQSSVVSGYVWTGTTGTGNLSINTHCQNWSNGLSNVNGEVGAPGYIGTVWSTATSSPEVCSFTSRLYCLSDADVIFWNNMEEPSL